MIKHSERVHALLSPSGSGRWLKCTPSAKLEDGCIDENRASFASEEGTVAHELAELALTKYAAGEYKPDTDPLPMDEKISNVDKYYSWEMELAVQKYVSFVLDRQKEHNCETVYVERGFNLDKYVPESFGSCDACMNNSSEAIIIDLKYGRSKVSAKNNSQLRMYALGFLESLTEEKRESIETVAMYIAQVRLDSFACEVLTKKELLEWADTELKPKAMLAYKGEGEKVAGSHCYFCKFKNMCEVNLHKRISDLFG